MRFLRTLLYTKQPSPAVLIDIALVLAIIPHLFVLKGFMWLYLLIAFYYIKKGKNKTLDLLILFLMGAIAILLSFFNNYNFQDFSRMQFFVSFISSLLLVAVTLQRTTHTINLYLKASPLMLMLLSFFFFDTISMLFYSVFVLYIFSLLMIWSRMDTQLLDILKLNTKLFLLSLPAVIVLFVAFPRISFEKANYGFRDDSYSYSGYSGSMTVSDKEVVNSSRVVMEVLFEDKMIDPSLLYFRGSTLYPLNQSQWHEDTTLHTKDTIKEIKQNVKYKLTLYPHAQKWFFALDIPINTPQKTKKLSDQTLMLKKDLYKPRHFELISALHYKLYSEDQSKLLSVDPAQYPKLTQALQALQKLPQEQKAKALMEFFYDQNLSYTLKPQGLDLENFVDSFMFDAKNGYCVHYAAAFATAARILGIPSRVVSGYKADLGNSVENYLIVKEKDAHAWVELYLEKEGWKRFDPTLSAVKNLDSDVEDARNNMLEKNSTFQKLNLEFMYVKYLINNWILDFNRAKQMQILQNFLNDTFFMLKIIAAFTLVVISVLLLVFFIRLKPQRAQLEKMMEPLMKQLAKKGREKHSNESMNEYLKHSQAHLGVDLNEINSLYHQIKYANKPELLGRLKKELLEFKF